MRPRPGLRYLSLRAGVSDSTPYLRLAHRNGQYWPERLLMKADTARHVRSIEQEVMEMRYTYTIVGTAIVTLASLAILTSQAHAEVCGGQSLLTCDDGSPCTVAADCPSGVNCVADCVVGGSQANAECLLNLHGFRLNYPSDLGPELPKAKKEIRCVDGAACDLDGVVNGRCTFEVSSCLGNEDPTFPGCESGLAVTQLVVKNGRGARFDPELANLQTRGRLVLGAPSGTCSEPAFVQVPLQADAKCGKIKKGKKKVDVTVVSAPDSRGRPRKDRDKVNLTCLPAPEAGCESLSGRVVRLDGMPVAGARVAVGGRFVLTNAAGRFNLTSPQIGYTPISVTKDGFLDAVQVIQIRDDLPPVEIVMLSERPSRSVVAGSGGVVEVIGNRVTFPANAFLRADGRRLDNLELVEVRVLPLDPSGPELAAFPGGFYGIDRIEGQSVVLESVALVNVTARTRAGENLQLAPGAPIQIELRIPRSEKNPVTGSAYGVGDTLPLWWLNPVTGVWEREGAWTAGECAWSPDDLCLFGQSEHMSWINVDVPWDMGPPILGPTPDNVTYPEVACLTGRVVDGGGTPMDDVEITVRGVDYSTTTWASTESDGAFCVHTKRASQVRLRATYKAADGLIDRTVQSPIDTSVTPGTCNDTSSCMSLPDVVIQEAPRSCVRGTVVDPNGKSVANASVGTSNGSEATTDRDGEFCLSAIGSVGDEVQIQAAIRQVEGTATATLSEAGGTCEVPATCTDLPPLVLQQIVPEPPEPRGAIVILNDLHVGAGHDPIVTLSAESPWQHPWRDPMNATCFFSTKAGCTTSSFAVFITVPGDLSWRAASGRPDKGIPPVPTNPFVGELVCVASELWWPHGFNMFDLQATYQADCIVDQQVCPDRGIRLQGFDSQSGDFNFCLGTSVQIFCPTGGEFEACPNEIPAEQIEQCWSQASDFNFFCP